MLFRRLRHTKKPDLRRLAQWALRQRESAPDATLERLYGAEHAAELGPLGWLFRAVEDLPAEEPTLGRWQQWERDLCARLALLPPPRAAFSGFLPPLLLAPGIQPAELKALAGDLIWKSATITAAATVLTAHMISSGALDDLRRTAADTVDAAVVETPFEPTGHVVLDRLRLTEAALQPGGDLDPALLRRMSAGVGPG